MENEKKFIKTQCVKRKLTVKIIFFRYKVSTDDIRPADKVQKIKKNPKSKIFGHAELLPD